MKGYSTHIYALLLSIYNFNAYYVLGINNLNIVIFILLGFTVVFSAYLFSNGDYILVPQIFIPIAAFFVLSIACLFNLNTFHFELSFKNIIRILAIGLLILHRPRDILNFQNVMFKHGFAFILLQIAFIIWEITDRATYNSFVFGETFSQNTILRVGGTVGDANFLGFIVFFHFILFRGRSKILDYCCILILILVQSRTIYLLVFLYMLYKNIRVGLIFGTFILLASVFFSEIIGDHNRFAQIELFSLEDGSIRDRLNSTSAVAEYLRTLSGLPVGGICFMSAWSIYSPSYHIPHNMILQILAEYSFLSIIIFSSWLYYIYHYQRKNYVTILLFVAINLLPVLHYYSPFYFVLILNEKNSHFFK